MKRLCILTQDRRIFQRRGYFIHALCRHWRRTGWEIVIGDDPADPPPADLAVLHIDATVVEPRWLEVGARYPRTLNLGAADISKRVVSTRLVERGDGYAGPVMVKTDRNARGIAERQYRCGPLRGAAEKIGLLLARRGAMGIARRYPVYPSPEAVPRRCWAHPGVVVERFMPEVVGDRYAMRMWVFMGDRSMHRMVYGSRPVIKSTSRIGFEDIDAPVPESLRRRRAELGFDYGKFDYVEHDGEAVLLDVTRTPGGGRAITTARADAYADLLGPGLESFVARGSA